MDWTQDWTAGGLSLCSRIRLGAYVDLARRHPAAEDIAVAKQVLDVWDTDGDGLLNLSEFSQLASDVRIFINADGGADGM